MPERHRLSVFLRAFVGLTVLLGLAIFPLWHSAETHAGPGVEEVRSSPALQLELQGRIAFASDRSGNYEIYIMNADGSDVTNVTNHPADDVQPAWSPDGARLAFSSGRDGRYDIYVMDADGGGITRLTDNPGSDYAPTWSPDASQIAYSCDWIGCSGYDCREICVVDLADNKVTRLTDNDYSDEFPSWSPDGSRIAISAFTRNEDPGIYVCGTDGSDLTRLTTTQGGDFVPDWSPDGQHLAFSSWRSGNSDIWIMRADGAAAVNVTDDPSNEYDTYGAPRWSPDGTLIAFVSDRHGNEEIYVLDPSSGEIVRLTNDPGRDRYPSWTGPRAAALPQAPAITEPPSVGGVAQGADFRGMLAGTSLPGSQVSVYQRLSDSLPIIDRPYGERIGQAEADGDGRWTVESVELLAGENLFVAVADVGGVWSEPSEELMLYSPTAPVITFPESTGGRANYGFSGDVAGTGPPNASIHLYRRLTSEPAGDERPHGEVVGTTEAGSAGNWVVRGLRLLPGDNVFVAVAELDGLFSPSSEPQYVAAPLADAYGARYTLSWGDDSLRVSIETLDTRDEAERTAAVLAAAGYESHSHLNAPAQEAYDYLPYAEVFYFSGHGSNSHIGFEVRPGDASSLGAGSIEQPDLRPLRLAVLNACQTGRDLDASNNIMQGFYRRGTDVVIGFTHILENGPALAWNTSFWVYALFDGYPVRDAAYQAARDVADLWWWPEPDLGIDENAVVVLGDGAIKVKLYE